MRKILSFILVLAMLSGQFIRFSALAEQDSLHSSHVRFDVEDGLSDEEYSRQKNKFVNQFNTKRSVARLMLSSATVSGNTLSNEFIEFAVNSSNGRFTVGTVAGNPDLSTDDNKIMLYGHSNPRTSYTTFHVNGESYIYGDNGFTVSPYFDNNSNYSETAFGDIHVKQEISIVENSATHRDDIVEIKYVVSNTGNNTASLGVRIMMDTMLGSNDAAPFRVPGYGDLTTEKEFSGDSIPQYWQAFDALNNPRVVSHGNFVSGAIKPDRVQFTNWGRVYNTPWDYHVSEGSSNGDSAVSIIWERSLAAGAQETYVTRYGLSELLQNLQPPLGLTIAAASSVSTTPEKDGYLSYPITIYIQNIGTTTAKNVACTIELPNELAFDNSSDSKVIHLIGNMDVGSLITIEENVYVKSPHDHDITTHFAVTVTADDTEIKRLSKRLIISAVNTGVIQKSGTFKYGGQINGERDSAATYYYSDAYFDDDARDENRHLATMSLCLELSAWTSKDVPNPNQWGTAKQRAQNAYTLLNDIGFTNVETSPDWDEAPDMHSMGAIAAYKTIQDTTVIALAVRGGGYYDEWGGNFVLGNSGNHKGFENGRDEVLLFLKNYISDHYDDANGGFKDTVNCGLSVTAEVVR